MKKIALLSLFLSFVFCSFAQLKFPKPLNKFYKFMPAGNVILNGDTLSVQAFYIFSHEMTNANWQEFRHDLERNGRTSDLEITKVHSENWNSKTNSNSPMAEHYYEHPAYRDYPVVNITHEAATLYCIWLTEKLNALPKPLGAKVTVRLPFHAELIRAGVGDKLGESYPWCHPYMQNTKGDFLANFIRVLNSQITRENGELKVLPDTAGSMSSADYLAPSISYWPSAFGIYNLSGNAAEMINTPGVAIGGSWMDYGHDIRLQSTKTYQGSAIDVGFRVVVTWLPE